MRERSRAWHATPAWFGVKFIAHHWDMPANRQFEGGLGFSGGGVWFVMMIHSLCFGCTPFKAERAHRPCRCNIYLEAWNEAFVCVFSFIVAEIKVTKFGKKEWKWIVRRRMFWAIFHYRAISIVGPKYSNRAMEQHQQRNLLIYSNKTVAINQ